MKRIAKHRILSLFLAITLLLSALPLNTVGANANEGSDYADVIGCTARFNFVFSAFLVCGDPQSFDYFGTDGELDWDATDNDGSDWDNDNYYLHNETFSENPDIPEDHLLVITDYFLDETSTALWYKVETAPGYELPQKMQQKQYFWVLQDLTDPELAGDDQLIIYDKATNIVYDENGNAITEITLPQYDKINVSVKTPLQGSVEYRWQVLVSESSTWVDVYGEDTAELPISYALVKNVLSDDGVAYVRSVTWNGENLGYSAAIKVTVDYDAKYLESPISVNPLEDSIEAAQTFSLLQARSLNAAVPAAEYETRTITIHYVDEDGGMVFEDHVESWPFGSSVTHSITLPIKVGYEAYYENEVITEFSLAEHVGTLNANVEFTIIYTPAEVEYTVHYLFQNITDDGYLENETIHATEVRTGKTGEMTKFTPPEIEGFTYLYYDEVEIAADGSTEIEIYYDREYYLISFDLGNGGYGTDPIYARYGATVVATVPTRSGWNFNGWNPTIEITNGAYQIQVTQNAIYTALWTRGDSTFTVVYWQENADPDKDANGNVVTDSSGHPVYSYSYWTHESDIAATTGDIINGADYKDRINALVDDEAYFTFNFAKTDSGVVVEGDGTTVVNVYYTRNTYTLYFYATGDCGITPHTHSDACYQYICDKSEHTHTADCLSCTQTEHIHDANCCTLTEHIHNSTPGECCNLYHVHTATCQCTKTEHLQHDSSCCMVEEHTHESCRWFIVYLCGKSEHTHGDGNCSYSDELHTHGDGTCTYDHGEHDHTSGCNSDACTSAYVHTHGDGTCQCTEIVHTHSVGCYGNCGGSVDHTHTDDCKRLACNLMEHAHGANCPTNDGMHVFKVVQAKYDSDITYLWESEPVKTYLDDGYVFQSSITGKYYSFLEKMPTQDINMTATKWSGNKYTWYYYLEVLPGQDTTGVTLRTDNGKTYYKYHETSVNGTNISLTYEEDYFPITGFEQRDRKVPSFSNRVAYLYYTRKTSNLSFTNINEKIEEKGGAYLYQADISDTYFVPNYPDTLEPNAYDFAGWYTSPECFDGTEFNFTSATMPSSDLALFAKWIPTTHTVNVWLDANMDTQIGQTQTVPHGDPANNPGEFNKGKYENYSHAGWFYVDTNGEEKAFVFNNMPINRDLDIYAKWSSTTAVKYDVHYVLGEENADGTIRPVLDADGNPVYVADSTYGTKLAGRSVTFAAKAKTELYAAYQGSDGEFYFPHTNSHTILMSVDEENTFTFYYLKMALLGYTVRYVNKDTGEEVHTSKVVSAEENDKSVVTETFVKVDGFMPDAYQKTLILSANEDENVIVFYYTEDKEHAFYRVNHYVEQLDGSYKLYSYFEGPGNIGKPVPEITKANINGYTYMGYTEGDSTTPSITAGDPPAHTLTADGYLVNLYYDLNEYPYVIRYFELGTDKELADPDEYLAEDQWKKYGDTFSGTAKVIAGYTLVSANEQTKQIDVDDTVNPKKNVITFYYTEDQAQINYVVIPNGGGEITRNQEIVNVVTSSALGSTPTAASGYKFVGWFTDPACSDPVPDGWVDENNHLNPQEDKGVQVPYESATYYAKFEANNTDLTIKKAYPENADYSIDVNQTFIFDIKGASGTATADIELTVTVHGDGEITITDLPIGKYTITEQTDWSWRYAPTDSKTSQTITLSPTEENIVTFENTRAEVKWLDGDSYDVNIFNGTAN